MRDADDAIALALNIESYNLSPKPKRAHVLFHYGHPSLSGKNIGCLR